MMILMVGLFSYPHYVTVVKVQFKTFLYFSFKPVIDSSHALTNNSLLSLSGAIN